MKTLSIMVLLLAVPPLAQAQQPYKAISFGAPGPTAWTVLANGDSLGAGTSTQLQRPITPGFLDRSLHCYTSTHQRDGKMLAQSGHCTVIDTEGDTFQASWQRHGDTEEGTYACLTGTGKYLNQTCEGTWRITAAFPDGRWVVEAEATVTMK